ncbi:phage holin family protein [Brevibacillus choshinensis]|uniref:Phage holin family protein n=1 Tax=Brevibacillus choshinensis TaxID=54911 RepID=A0ABX7FSA5_BRECH|nr:phage holin family protein [Brevibacillus choshinensis]QRG68615.1 phage holin family protein [Brevibacillus choshinensis]
MKFLQSLENVATPANGWAATTGALLTPIFQYFYGSDRLDILVVLLSMISLDWVTGVYASKKDNTYSSEYGLSRIPRTLFLVALPAIANLLDRVMGTPGFLFFGVTFGLIYHTWTSLTANAHRAGWPIPKSIVTLVGSEIKAKAERAARKETK